MRKIESRRGNYPILLLCYYLVIGFLFAPLFESCVEPPKGKTKQEVIQERLAKRINQWHKSITDKCDRQVFEMATSIVDSTLIANARARKERQENRPRKPLKPGQPEIEIPEDTTPIAPFILLELLLTKDSAFIDSLFSSDSIEIRVTPTFRRGFVIYAGMEY